MLLDRDCCIAYLVGGRSHSSERERKREREKEREREREREIERMLPLMLSKLTGSKQKERG
jgi:hypothetical protein